MLITCHHVGCLRGVIMLNYFRKKKQEKMNKIVDEVVSQIEVKMENLFDHFVSRLNGQEIDYYELSQNIEYDDLGEYIDISFG